MAADHASTVRNEAHAAKPDLEDLLDLEFEASCSREADDAVTLDEVRRATANIPGSMAQAIIDDERADRF